MAKHDPYQALRHRAFVWFSFPSALVHIGASAQGVAIAWEVYSRTGSYMALGIVPLLQFLPMVTLTIPSGFLADQLDRKRLMLLSMAGTTLTSVGLAVFSIRHGSIVVMYLLLLWDATALTLGRPARTALQVQLVPPEVYENAMKWRSTLFQVSAVVGPAVGGVIVAWWTPAAYLFAATTSVLFFLVVLKMHVPGPDGDRERITWGSVLAGVEFIWGHKILLAAVALDMFAVLFGGAVHLLPVFAKDILQVGETGLGWLRAAPAMGALVMGFVLAHMPPLRRAGRTLLWAVAGFGVATIVFGLSRSFWLSMAMLILTGGLDNISVVVRHTLVQLITPDRMRGRVSAVNTIFIGSSNELGGFESGLVASLTNPTTSVVSGGTGTLLVVGTTALVSKKLRRVRSLEAVAEEARSRRGMAAPVTDGQAHEPAIVSEDRPPGVD